MRAKKSDQNFSTKIKNLFDAAGIQKIITEGDLVALKIHFGTGGNQRHLEPQHIRAIADKVKETGGQPFVTDTTGIGLSAPRGTALGCLRHATLHGFTQEVLGAPVIVADGLKGLTGCKIKINGVRMKEIEIAQAIAESDAMISIAHVKGHPRTGFGASLKNVGIGCISKVSKAPLHMSKKPKINSEKCNNCGLCIPFCPVEAIQRHGKKPKISSKKCIVGCGCWDICPENAITKWGGLHHRNKELIIRNVDAAAGVLKYFGKKKVAYFNFAYDITPHCDCADYGDVPMVPDIGLFVSNDPVAIDKASTDAINNSLGIKGTATEEIDAMKIGEDKIGKLADWDAFQIFKNIDGTREWKLQFEIAEKLGLGTQKYKLITID